MKHLLLLLLVITTAAADYGILREYTKGNAKFSSDIYKKMLKTNYGNFLVCTMSVETVFALMNAGAKGKTSSQIITGFRFPSDANKIQKIFKELSSKFQHTGEYNLSSANKIYVGNGVKIEDDFKNIAKTVYNAEVQDINFDEAEAAAKEINNWVEKKTFSKIKDLLSKNDISAFTKLVLVNAMYFKANWLHKFHRMATKKRDFFLNEHSTVKVDTMELTNSFRYHECEKTNAKYLDMKFKGTNITMTIVLPNAKDGLGQLEKQLENVVEVSINTSQTVHVRLPQFEMGSKIEFKPILNELGVVDAFTDNADFSGIIGDSEIHIDKVIQKTFIKVDEDGTTAAAATAVMAKTSIAIQKPAPPKEFFADHPFIYILRSPEWILFIGRYVKNTE